MSFVGCHKEETPRCGGENPITFYSNIPGSYMSAPESRVQGNLWQAEDAIGVYMMQTGKTAPLGKANARYTTKDRDASEASFTPATEADALRFPYTGNVDFVAYYPYMSLSEGNTSLSLDVSNQSQPKDIDLLYATAANVEKSNAVALTFRHILPQLVFQFKDENEQPIPSSSISDLMLLDVAQKATFDLMNATLTPTGTPSDLKANASDLTFLMLPGLVKPLVATFEYKGKQYRWEISQEGKTFEKGKKYTFSVMVLKDKIVYSESVNATIEDRGVGDHITGDPLEPLDGANTQQQAISITEEGGGTPLKNGAEVTLPAGAASSKSFNISTNGGVPWSASVNAEAAGWLHLTTTSSTLQLKADANDQTTSRTAQLTIKLNATTSMRADASLVLRIVQEGKAAQPIELKVTPTALDAFPANGGIQQVTINVTPLGTEWTYTVEGEGFAAKKGTDPTQLQVEASANTTNAARVGSLVVTAGSASKTISLSQAAAKKITTYGTNIIITGYCCGTTKSERYIELYNPTDHTIALEEYRIFVYTKTGTSKKTISLSGCGLSLAPQEYVLLHSGGDFAAKYPGKKFMPQDFQFDGLGAVSLAYSGDGDIDMLGVSRPSSPEINSKNLFSKVLVRKKGFLNPCKTFVLDQWIKQAASTNKTLEGFYMPERQ